MILNEYAMVIILHFTQKTISSQTHDYKTCLQTEQSEWSSNSILTKKPHPILHRRGSLVAVFGVVEWLMMVDMFYCCTSVRVFEISFWRVYALLAIAWVGWSVFGFCVRNITGSKFDSQAKNIRRTASLNRERTWNFSTGKQRIRNSWCRKKWCSWLGNSWDLHCVLHNSIFTIALLNFIAGQLWDLRPIFSVEGSGVEIEPALFTVSKFYPAISYNTK